MMRIAPDHPELANLQPEQIASYARDRGWHQIEQPNEKLVVYQYKEFDLQNKPIQLVLPRQASHTHDAAMLLALSINLLAAIEGESPESILNRVEVKNSGHDSIHALEKIKNLLGSPSSPLLERRHLILSALVKIAGASLIVGTGIGFVKAIVP